MIAKSYILYNLRFINKRYRQASNPKESLLLSKLAIIELCGWIEESMDDIIRRTSKKGIFYTTNKDYIEEVIKLNFGFSYKNHFRYMLIRVIGLVNVEKLESTYNNIVVDRMKAVLGVLKKSRDEEAHSHIKGITRTINSPSITISQFPHVYNGLMEIDKKIRKLKY